MTFDQGRDLAVLATEQEITLPVTRYRTIFSFSGSLADRDDISDLTTTGSPIFASQNSGMHVPSGNLTPGVHQ